MYMAQLLKVARPQITITLLPCGKVKDTSALHSMKPSASAACLRMRLEDDRVYECRKTEWATKFFYVWLWHSLAKREVIVSLYAKVWFSFRVLANLAGKTHKSASNLVQIEQIPRYHPHIPKTSQSFIFEAIQISVSHENNPR